MKLVPIFCAILKFLFSSVLFNLQNLHFSLPVFFSCSKKESGCLLDLPAKSKRVDYEKIGRKPGILYDADKQCEMILGTGSKFCKEKACLKSLHLQLGELVGYVWVTPAGLNPHD